MASVFLSYDREDAAKARSVAVALEKAGHGVWWDRQIAGGAEYGSEIEEALKRSDAVVVLWSEHAVRSAWVRDEAAAGRDSGKLVPVRLDASDPPMGFRQYQTIDLARLKGSGGAKPIQELDRAIQSLLAQKSGAPHFIAPSNVTEERQWPNRRWVATALAIATLVAGVWFVARMVSVAAAPVVAVTAADTSAASQRLARNLFVKLGPLQAIETSPIKLIDRDEGGKADFVFAIGGSTLASQAQANITLTGKDSVLLWSRDFDAPGNRTGDLEQQLALSAGRVLECATQALSSGNVDQPTLKMFLNGCASLDELAGTDFRPLVPLFRRVTDNAPKFEGGWAKLLLTESYFIGWETLPADSPEAATLRKDVATVRAQYPEMPEAYWADFQLNYNNLARKADIIERGIAAHPDSPLLLSAQAGFLQGVGRTTEAVEKAKRASDLSPLSPGERSQYINVLGWAGKPDAALAELEKAEKLWPGASIMLDTRWRYHLRYGDPKEALRITRSGVNAAYANQESYLSARIDPSPANVERAIAEAKARVGRVPRATGILVQILAEFGRTDEVFRLLAGPEGRSMTGSVDAFFRPAFRKVRQDPQFIRVAQRNGLLDYWRKSGKWPDFCFEPDLPYDCEAEAAKLGKRAA